MILTSRQWRSRWPCTWPCLSYRSPAHHWCSMVSGYAPETEKQIVNNLPPYLGQAEKLILLDLGQITYFLIQK